jgi:hypothetical protein
MYFSYLKIHRQIINFYNIIKDITMSTEETPVVVEPTPEVKE